MGDIAIVKERTGLGDVFDFDVASSDLVQDDGLRTCVLISLFSDRRAELEDVGTDEERRGWWGDALTPGDRIGSKLWLLDRAKQTDETRTRAEEYALEALQWMLDDGVASSVDAVASWDAAGFLSLKVSITRPNGANVTYTFDKAWTAEEQR